MATPEEGFSKKSELSSFVTPSREALELKFVRCEDDFFNDNLTFSPEYTHQVFGENEVIFGYRDLKVQLFYTPDHLDTYIGISHKGKVDPSQHDGTRPDNIIGTLSEYIPDGYYTHRDRFLSVLSPSKTCPFTPHGDLIHSQSLPSESGSTRNYVVYKTDVTTPGFRKYHERLQTFLMWFVDAASFIDVDDDKWSFYLMYEQNTLDDRVLYSIVGYCTVYSYYSYPDKTKPRISQMLIMPPYQRMGLGSILLETVYNSLTSSQDVNCITVEDPSPEFTALRDFIDCKAAQQLEQLQPPRVLETYSSDIESLMRENLKLDRHQCRRVYEILRLRATDHSNSDQYLQYRLLVKNRLNGSYKKQQRDLSRLSRFMDPVQLALTYPQQTVEERRKDLHADYQQLEIEYRNVIEKLASTRC